ncbi:hypothetical protein ACWD5Q_23665 [Streptomyces sp. NPDC002513]
MTEQDLLEKVHHLAWVDTGHLECQEAGHAPGHVCLPLPQDMTFPALLEKLGNWYGRPRPLVDNGHTDPKTTEGTGLPLVEPFGQDLVEMHAWACRSRWIGCGTTRIGDGIQPGVLIAERADPAAGGLPPDASWLDKVVAITGWSADVPHTVDWADVESRLGTALPSDYKQLAELFGYGAFDGYLSLSVPSGRHHKRNIGTAPDIVRDTEWLAQWREQHRNLWEPYDVFPAPGGLLKWGTTPDGTDEVFWLAQGTDPDQWPVLVTDDARDVWERFDGSTTEFIYRMLTDRQHTLSTAKYFDIHWFMPL